MFVIVSAQSDKAVNAMPTIVTTAEALKLTIKDPNFKKNNKFVPIEEYFDIEEIEIRANVNLLTF